MKKVVRRIAVIVILLIVLGIGGYQIIRFLYPPYEFETAYQTTVDDFMEAKGLMIRDEEIVGTKKDGYAVSYTQSDGSKIAKNSVVARLYSDNNDIQYQAEIDEMNAELELLEKAEQSAVVYTSGNDMSAKQLNEQLYLLSDIMEGTNAASADELHDNLLFELNRRQVSLGTVEDFSARKIALQSEIEQLEKQIKSGIEDILSTEAGYFTSVVDGFEDRLSMSSLSFISVSELESMMQEEQVFSDVAVGKVIVGYDWYLAIPIQNGDEKKFEPGNSVSIQFEDQPDVRAPGTVEEIKKDETSDTSFAIITMNYMNGQLSRARTENVRVTFASYTGLRIPRSALRIEDGKEGVYVNEQNYATFKRVNTIYQTDSYVICSENGLSSEELVEDSWLQLYDNVIVEGRDLYEGKPLR